MKAVNWELYMLILMEVVLILRDCGDKSTYQSFKRFRLTFFFFFKFLAVFGLHCGAQGLLYLGHTVLVTSAVLFTSQD